MWQKTQKKYRQLGKKLIEIKEPLKVDEIENFGGKIWEKQNLCYNKNANWIGQLETDNIQTNQQEWYK